MVKKSFTVGSSLFLFIFGLGATLGSMGWDVVDVGLLVVGCVSLLLSILVWVLYIISSPDIKITFRKRGLKSSLQVRLIRKSPDIPLKEKQESRFCYRCGLVIENSISKCKNCGKKVKRKPATS
jgi:hypothetical protein